MFAGETQGPNNDIRQFLTGSHGQKMSTEREGSYLDTKHQVIKQSRNEFNLPSVRTTARANNNSSLLDLVSGVSTSGHPKDSSAPYVGKISDRRVTMGGKSSTRVHQNSSKLSPS